MVKASMNLTERDVENADVIWKTTQARSKAQAISTALSLTRFIIEQMLGGAELLIRSRNGDIERVVMPELQNLKPAPPQSTEVAQHLG